MKNLIRPLIALAIVATTFTSCMDKGEDIDYEGQILAQERSIDSVLNSQRSAIQAYVAAEFTNPVTDTTSINLTRLGKKVTRGMYYEVLSEPTNSTYEYKYSGSGFVVPTVKLKYTVSTLSKTVVQSDATGGTYTLNYNNAAFSSVWLYSFYPYSISYNGNQVKIDQLGGLTKDGLKTGSKFRIISPSLWTETNSSSSTIPANQPLVYEFEVLSIE
ncbi:hypothetical protein GCM10017764_08130 [Sphingobacterium griseoflavum]|uniref:Peptidylprolyl isomerase n=2 Tax=Sphingobacterium griseoflavum TaxID=1474952 RepID=A0ABQ3HRE1_9SPHI|nr:hypothetical protein GCM10017764_08130 [Sphingobacterium griseoflavum]